MSKAKRKQRITKQNNLYFVLGVALVIALAGASVLLLSPWGDEPGYPREVSVAEAAEMREEGAFILDVRTPGEWEAFHITGSTLIPLDQLERRISEVPTDQQIVVVCRSGNRSQTGRDILQQAGLEQVTSMSGGLSQWKAFGYPTEAGP